ncbi:hypothetical protein [Hydrogenophaga sp. Root209]|uniref:hypothetical protein n=1 Tax=Hydrogenophaga sp. Root209 TaxID=1736490 RepID=UPI000ACA84B5|nr:hypothetical protein [Hydrogenophaga sp. Root209]
MNELKRFRALCASMALASALTACGGGGAASSGAALTPQEQIAQLEASGALPSLDRTDSVAGIDANANGVRDDIERYIEKKYTVAAERAAAMQMARAFQQMLLVNKQDAAALEAVSELGSRAIVCGSSVFAGPAASVELSQMTTSLESMTTNTKLRLLAYLEYNKARSGSVSTMPKGAVCD